MLFIMDYGSLFQVLSLNLVRGVGVGGGGGDQCQHLWSTMLLSILYHLCLKDR